MKDRAALYVVKDAEEKGLIKPGGTVVEGTAGNTGIGLAVGHPFLLFTKSTVFKYHVHIYSTSVEQKAINVSFICQMFVLFLLIFIRFFTVFES